MELLEWSVNKAESSQKVYQAAIDKGLEPPESCIPPYLPEHLDHYMNAYWQLSTCRALGPGGVGPIPWWVIDHYAERTGIHNEILYDDFMFYMTAMDNAYLSIQAETIEKQAENTGDTKTPKKGGIQTSSDW